MSEYIVKCTEVIGISGNVLQIPDYIDLNSEIVRCRDCKHFEYCQFHRHSKNKPNGFCAWGKPRGEGEGE